MDSQGKPIRVHIGEEALKLMFKHNIEGKAGKTLDLNALAPFHTDGHLLSAGQKAEVEKKTKEVLGLGSDAGVTSASSTGSGSAGLEGKAVGPRGGNRAKASAADDGANVMKLFS